MTVFFRANHGVDGWRAGVPPAVPQSRLPQGEHQASPAPPGQPFLLHPQGVARSSPQGQVLGKVAIRNL